MSGPIKATYDDTTVTVYQTCSDKNADEALKKTRFSVSRFEDIVWLKTSFLWTMYKSSWTKATNQERVLAIKLNRSKFEFALANASLEKLTPELRRQTSKVCRLRFDTDRDLGLNSIPGSRTYQICLNEETIVKYSKEWIVEMNDVTELSKSIETLVRNGQLDEAKVLIPTEMLYQFKSHSDRTRFNLLFL